MTREIDHASVSTQTAAAWLRRWDAQQEAYVADREERFAVIADVVEFVVEGIDRPVVVDLGCGPGSLAARLHERIPRATVIGVDSDPLLLGLGRAHYRDAIEWVDADLSGQSWRDRIPATIHAAVSTTALHWLPTDRLAGLYRTLGSLIAPGGVLVNGDHLGLGDERAQALAVHVRNRRAERAGVEENEKWEEWWRTIQDEPEFAELWKLREQRIADRRPRGDGQEAHDHDGNGLTAGEHAALLRSAGFAQVSPVWQVGDDHVLVALR